MTGRGSLILVDAHVHFHRCFNFDAFLTAADNNFRRISADLGLDAPALGLMVLTAGSDDWSLRDVREEEVEISTSEWTLERTAEELSLLARCRGRVKLVLVAGRQLQTVEALEVLALGCDEDLSQTLPIAKTLTAVRESGALPVVPWGLGKWWGRRGRVLQGLLETEVPDAFFLGDNGGRPAALPRPGLLSKAHRLGIRDLPGSDPFPFARELERVGSRGSVIEAALERETPAASLLALLRDPGVAPKSYGRGEEFLPFLKKQLGIQLHRRFSERFS